MMAIGRIRQTLVARCQFNTLGCGRSSAGGGCLASVARPRIGVTFAAYADRDREEIFTVPYPYLSTLACVCGVSCAWMWFGLLGAAERSTALPRIALKQLMLILAFALIGWALCGAIIGIGRSVMSLATTLIVHAIGAALIFGVLSFLYFRRFNYTTPLQTAVIFVAAVIIMDGLVVASLIERSFAMFASVLGTWIPFALIFLTTYLVGLYLQAQGMHQQIGESGRVSTH